MHNFPLSRFSGVVQRTGSCLYGRCVRVLSFEVLELAGIAARYNKIRVIPSHLMLAIRNDKELNEVFGKVTIACAGVCRTLTKF